MDEAGGDTTTETSTPRVRRHREHFEVGTERLEAREVDEDLTDLLFDDAPVEPTYPER